MSIISMIDAASSSRARRDHCWKMARVRHSRGMLCLEMEMNAKYARESSCVYCSAFRKAPGSLALQSVDVINRKTLCFWS